MQANLGAQAAGRIVPAAPPHTTCSFTLALLHFPCSQPAMQIINVDDNTVAFAQWGLGSMAAGEGEELPDTVVSKKSRHSTATLPASAGKTPGGRGVAGNNLAC